jgi:hypothetical protein
MIQYPSSRYIQYQQNITVYLFAVQLRLGIHLCYIHSRFMVIFGLWLVIIGSFHSYISLCHAFKCSGQHVVITHCSSIYFPINWWSFVQESTQMSTNIALFHFMLKTADLCTKIYSFQVIFST